MTIYEHTISINRLVNNFQLNKKTFILSKTMIINYFLPSKFAF